MHGVSWGPGHHDMLAIPGVTMPKPLASTKTA